MNGWLVERHAGRLLGLDRIMHVYEIGQQDLS